MAAFPGGAERSAGLAFLGGVHGLRGAAAVTTLVPITTDTLAEQEAINHAIAQLLQAQARIPNADPEELAQMRAWAQAAEALAAAKKAQGLAIEAGLTRPLTERHLGQIIVTAAARTATPRGGHSETARALGIHLDTNALRMVVKLAAIPAELFEPELTEIRSRDLSPSASATYRRIREHSAESVEPGILRAWDGSCLAFSKEGGSRWCRDLKAARELIHEWTRLRNAWSASTVRRNIDELYARARQLAQGIETMRDTVASGEARRLLGDAEHRAGETASPLDQALTAALIHNEAAA